MKQSSKEKLDRLLEQYKAQPVGIGYIDIIVSRDNYKSFAKSLIEGGFEIDAISWWEYIASLDAPNTYGMGGPVSQFYPGWFAETCTAIDNVSFSGDPANDLNSIIGLVENKVLGVSDGKQISFKETPSLTPAFWLKVDENWTNVQTRTPPLDHLPRNKFKP